MKQDILNRLAPKFLASGTIFIIVAGLLAGLPMLQNHFSAIFLLISAGAPNTPRSAIADEIAKQAEADHVNISYLPSQGSLQILDLLKNKKLNLGLYQGDISVPDNVCFIASLGMEPLHLLVKPGILPELQNQGLKALANKVVSLSELGSGTRWLAIEILDVAGGIQPESNDSIPTQGKLSTSWLFVRDINKPTYFAGHWSYKSLTSGNISLKNMPDAVFTVSTIQSEVAKTLIARYHYELTDIPNAPLINNFEPETKPFTINHGLYYISQPDIHTVSTPLYLAASQETPASVVKVICKIIYENHLSHLPIPVVVDKSKSSSPPFQLHPGTVSYFHQTNYLLYTFILGLVQVLMGLIMLLRDFLR